MKIKIYSTVLVLSLAASTTCAIAGEETKNLHGSIELGGMSADTDGDEARFQEFRDIDDSIISTIQLDYQKDTFYYQFDAIRPGLDDQSYLWSGGKPGFYNIKFYYDKTPHNYTYDAITPFTGIGTNNLTYVATPAVTSTWTKFDYAVDHKSYGGELKFSFNTPVYALFNIEKRAQEGLRPYTIVTEHTNGAGRKFAEVPEPIDNSTDNMIIKSGYRGESITASVSTLLSDFNNNHKYFTRPDVFAADSDVDKTNVLAQDNKFYKLAGDLSWRDLPLSSVLSLHVSRSKLTNAYSAAEIGWTRTPAMLAALASFNRTTFEGKINYTDYSAALASRPMDKLDTKLYFKYLERENESTIISYGPAADDTNNAKELLSYEKMNFGIEIDYRLPQRTNLEAGFDYLDMDRTTPLAAYTDAGNFAIYRYDNPASTTDDTVFIGIKNSCVDWLTTKIRYTRLDRDSDFNFAAAIANGVDPDLLTTRFDTQAKTMDEWKLSFDVYPLENIDLGIDFKHQDTDYDYNYSSRNNDKRQSIYADALWRTNAILSLGGFIGFENTEIDSNRRPNHALNVNPNRIETTDDDYWTYGLNGKAQISDQLTIDLSWQYEDSDGSLIFTDLGLAGGPFVNIENFDDYTRKQFEAKATYAVTAQITMTVGYLYEKLKYQDFTLNGYTNINGTDYLSNLYANPNYEANVGYIALKYGF